MRRVLFIILFLLVVQAPAARADVVVIVRREAETSGKYIRVCDVARVEGPRERAREVAETIIGPTPPKGQAREISRWEIESRLYEMGYDAKVTFSGNDSVRVLGNGVPARSRADEGFVPERLASIPSASGDLAPRSAAPSPSPSPAPAARAMDPGDDFAFDPDAAGAARERVGIAASDYLSSRYDRKDVEVRAKVLSLSDGIAPGDEIVVSGAIGGKIPGRAEVAVRVKGGADGPVRQITAVLDTEVHALALIAAKPLYKGNVIGKNDVKVARVKMKSGQAYLPPQPEAAIGREVRRPIKPHEPVLAADAKPVDAVKQGTIVSVENSGAAWKLQANARALGSGNIDDVVFVQDLSNKSRYQARVIGPGMVTVVVPGDKRNKN
ncbi:MAG: flagellar basal body P-ring formation chaperone FlgA [Planctomycetota bacterium]|jgi:flagella basal body P-ring formation protein FlgA|nr:flagellar basal body P-ring formation chaperone FlgA [Planctomycetota bacterium]